MILQKVLDINLSLFDGAAPSGDGTSAAAIDTGSSSQKGEIKAPSGSTRRGKTGEYDNVRFGKQDNSDSADSKTEQIAQDSDAGSNKKPDVTVTSNTLEERRKAFGEMVNGEYKDVYAEEIQRIIDRRFKETKNLEKQMNQNQPVIDMLMQRYKIADGDVSKLLTAIENDDAYWSEAAEEAGMSVEQFKQFQKLQRENESLLRAQRQQQSQQAAEQQLQKWYTESETVKNVYPDFDLNFEVKNPQFLSLLRAGVPVQHAYEVIHMDDIKANVAQSTARQTEKQVVDHIRTKGARPAENGTSSQSAFTVKADPSKWSKEDRAEVARRVARGEIIKL